MSCKLLCRDLNGSPFPIAHWWRLFLKPFPFVPPLKTSAGLATRGCYNNVNIPINQRWSPVPSGIIKDPHLFFPYGLINWNNFLVGLWGQSDIITATKTTQTLSPRQWDLDTTTELIPPSKHSQYSFSFLQNSADLFGQGLNERSKKSFQYRRN